MKWHWPLGNAVRQAGRPLFQVTYPIALSEMLWGTSAFVYIIVFTQIGTDAPACSQIVSTVENLFIVLASGLAPAALATAGQALGHGSLPDAKEHAKRVLRTGTIAGLIFGLALIGVSFLLPVIYPQVGENVLGMANWGILVMAFVQWAKVLNSALGTGILPRGGDTKFVLFSHVISSYAIGLPVAALTGIGLRLGTWSVFGSRALEEVVKAAMLFSRYRSASWLRRLKM
jgi:MATE family, multidrug efflux pump